MTNCTNPCPACPFSKAVEPGALGGSPVSTYIGQVFGPFVLPCHKHCNFDDPAWKVKSIDTPQCAGAAEFRANVGIAPFLPPALHRLPANSRSFETAQQFIGHHMKINRTEVVHWMDDNPINQLVFNQLNRASTINFNNVSTTKGK